MRMILDVFWNGIKRKSADLRGQGSAFFNMADNSDPLKLDMLQHALISIIIYKYKLFVYNNRYYIGEQE